MDAKATEAAEAVAAATTEATGVAGAAGGGGVGPDGGVGPGGGLAAMAKDSAARIMEGTLLDVLIGNIKQKRIVFICIDCECLICTLDALTGTCTGVDYDDSLTQGISVSTTPQHGIK